MRAGLVAALVLLCSCWGADEGQRHKEVESSDAGGERNEAEADLMSLKDGESPADLEGSADLTPEVSGPGAETEITQGGSDDGEGEIPPVVGVYPLDDTLRLNHVQALGTHNSYHVQPQAPLHPSHKYTMPSLSDQLELHGVRQFEWDLHWHEDGHIEVFHLPLIDALTTCALFAECLEETGAWSQAHPDHLPLVIWMELKDDLDSELLGDFGSLEWHYQDVEDAILAVFEPKDVLSPDEVRGEHGTLPEALSVDGWPTLGALRGRVIFVFLEDGHHRDNYLEGAPALEGRLLFVDSDSPEDPFAAFFKINNALSDFETVQARVQAGFIVTSNVDDVDGSAEGNGEKLAASLDSGAHFLSTNWPALPADNAYYGNIPGGQPARCNPLSAPQGCSPAALENLDPESP